MPDHLLHLRAVNDYGSSWALTCEHCSPAGTEWETRSPNATEACWALDWWSGSHPDDVLNLVSLPEPVTFPLPVRPVRLASGDVQFVHDVPPAPPARRDPVGPVGPTHLHTEPGDRKTACGLTDAYPCVATRHAARHVTGRGVVICDACLTSTHTPHRHRRDIIEARDRWNATHPTETTR
jgi:hypothetical protein